MNDIWTQAAEGGDDQVQRELLAEADRIKLFIKLASGEALTLEPDSTEDEDELLDRLGTELYILDGEYPFPNWVRDWYLKVEAWKAAGYVPPENE